jgi:hypothetical protein
MTKFDAMFPGVGTPCSDEDIAKEMATLAKANRGTGKDLANNLSLATAFLEFKFGVTNGLTIHNSSGEIEDGNYSSNEIAGIFINVARVVGQLCTPPSFMMIGMPARVHLFSMISTR